MSGKGLSVEEVVNKYSDMVYRLAYARCGNIHDAQDITQDVFIKYMKAEKEFRDEEHRKAWLLTVTANEGYSLMRSAWNRHKTDYEEAESASYIEPEFQKDTTVSDAVAKLDEKYRIVIHLFYYEELSLKMIAHILHITEGGVKARLFRAREILKDKLKGAEYEF